MTSFTRENRSKLARNVFDSVFSRSLSTLGAVILIASLAGCQHQDSLQNSRQTIIAPLSDELPFRYEGKLGRNWGGDEFEIYEARVIHFVRLAGVTGPEPGQPLWSKARSFFWKQYMGKAATIVVTSHDEYKCEVGTIEIDGKDLGLMMIENGWAWFDASTSSDPKYQRAEQEAQRNGIGVWQVDSPTSPLEYRARQEETYRTFLQGQTMRPKR